MRKLRRMPQGSAGVSPASSRHRLDAGNGTHRNAGRDAPRTRSRDGRATLFAGAGRGANGTLFGDGVCARIKEELLKEFNLHTIVRLPNGVFARTPGIPTNILFFDRSGPTREVWYYEQPLPEGRKNYTKTAPIQFEEFAPLVAWWGERAENERAWKVPAGELLASGCNLDRKNRERRKTSTHLPPEQLAASILQKEQRIAEIVGNIQKLLTGKT